MTALESFVKSITPNDSDKFPGCDAGDPGSPQRRALWLFGVEPGYSLKDEVTPPSVDDDYTVDMQMQWPFNRNAFKLITLLEGQPLERYREYARQQKIFQNSCAGYFKGNLYPVGVRSIDQWTDKLVKQTGFASKAEYYQWCRENHFPRIRGWVDEYQPKLIIGTGVSFLNDFALAFLGGASAPARRIQLKIGKGVRNLYFFEDSSLVVVPHLSGGPSGLTSHAALTQAAEAIRNALGSIDL